MSKGKIVLLIISLVLIIAGGITFGFTINNYIKRNEATYVENTTIINSDISKIKVDTDTSKIYIRMSSDETCKVVCVEKEDDKHVVDEKDGVLSVSRKEQPTRFLDNLFVFNTKSITVTIYLNKTNYENLNINGHTGDVTVESGFTFGTVEIENSTGDMFFSSNVTGLLSIKGSTSDIEVKNVSANSLYLRASTGDITAKNINIIEDITIDGHTSKINLEAVRCKNITSTNTTGKVNFNDVVATDDLKIDAGTGDITIVMCDGKNVYLTASTGDITGTLLTGKMFTCISSTGKVAPVASDKNGGECIIKTSTGDIDIKVKE